MIEAAPVLQSGTVYEVGGYLVPLSVLLTVLALLVGLLLATSFALTMGLSVSRYLGDRRRERVRDDVQTELLDRLYGPGDPGWEEWAASLSTTERRVAESLLGEFLRELDGTDAERLRPLGSALGVTGRARERLGGGDEYRRLQALTWLTLLCDTDPVAAVDFEATTARERAALVRLLSTCDELADADAAVSLLLDGIDEQFTVFGQDTLYRVTRRDPGPLFARASDRYREWPKPLFAQVLAVCKHLDTSAGETDLTWLTAALEDETEAIRAAAARALGSFGWHESLRDRVFLERAVADPSPRVRAAVYEMLGSWGDESALSVLLYALVSEDDPRALERGTHALVTHRDRVGEDGPAVLGEAWRWSSEHDRYDGLARRGGRVSG
ncbi:HEAT repeat domain-containing protein [Haloarcula litorea]|uniref:HEAT repeat domain-containing protein n=1 Tax=Haloarcula litorea TaxID=3032579 RepID=UPI0023E86C2D|nr:HEAT repeat domain-containing protein [Halomicroarcula sp. GDY20]